VGFVGASLPLRYIQSLHKNRDAHVSKHPPIYYWISLWSLHHCCCTRFLLLGFDLHSTQIRTITLLHSFQTFQLWITKMMSKTLLLTYFYLFIYILLSSAVILYNKVTNYYSFTSILFLPSNLLFIHSSSLSQCSGFYLQSTLIFHFPSHLPWFIWLFLELLLFFLSVFLRFVCHFILNFWGLCSILICHMPNCLFVLDNINILVWCNTYCPLYWILVFHLFIASYVAPMTLTRQQHRQMITFN